MMGLAKKQSIIVIILMVGTFLVVLNQTLLSPALAVIMRDLSIDATTVQYIMSAYSLVEAVVIPLSAYLMGRFTTRQLYITGLSIFIAGSVLAAISPSFPVLLLGRTLQAIAAGVFMPMIFTVILLIFPREKRGAGMGLVTLVIGFAPAVGPTLSGLLVDSIGWRMLFVVVTAVSAIILVAAIANLENYGNFERTTFDKPSVVLSTLGLVALLYGFSSFTSSDNVVIPLILIVIGIGICAIFVKRQLGLETPLLRIRVLASRNYRIAVILAMINFGTVIGMSTILPLYLQNVCGYNALQTGLTMLPGALLGAFVGMLAGRLFDSWGVRKCAIPGVITFLIGGIGTTFFSLDPNILFVVIVYAVITIGNQFLTTPINTWGINSLDNRVIQHANAVTNTLNQVSASFMTALIVSISALGWIIAPQGSVLEQTYQGDHLAFMAVCLLTCISTVIIFTLVRDRKTEKTEPSAQASYVMESLPADTNAQHLPVSLIMNKKPVFVTESASIREVGQLLVDNRASGLPIVSKTGNVVGFISDGDIMNYIGRADNILDSTYMVYQVPDLETFSQRVCDLIDMNVMKIATKHVVSLNADTSLEDACRLLSEKRIKIVPVVQDEKLVGSLSRADIVRATMANLVTIKAMAKQNNLTKK